MKNKLSESVQWIKEKREKRQAKKKSIVFSSGLFVAKVETIAPFPKKKERADCLEVMSYQIEQ